MADIPSARKSRLFHAAVARLLAGWFVIPAQATAVEVAERYADGEATDEEREQASTTGGEPANDFFWALDSRHASVGFLPEEFADCEIPREGNERIETFPGLWAASAAAEAVAYTVYAHEYLVRLRYETDTAKRVGAAERLLNVHGDVDVDDDPAFGKTYNEGGEAMEARVDELRREFTGVGDRPFDPAWRTANVLAVAGDIYHHRDFASMGVLADALEDAGCIDGALLTHLRSPGPHVRGCWALDAILDKE